MKNYARIIFVVCLLTAVVLIVAGFLIPPYGVVDGSVLSAVGELFAFAALGQLPEVIRTAKSAKITAGNKTIEIEGSESGKAHADPEENN